MSRIEEIDDDGSVTQNRFTPVDDDEFDDDMDFDLPELPSTVPSQPAMRMQHDQSIDGQDINYVQDTAQFKGWMTLYPIYFDASRSTKHGRRIGKSQAVKNPLAKTIADACKIIGFSIVFEPQKTHPADWSNPGRVRIEFRDKQRRLSHPTIKTKSALLKSVAKYLQSHATTLQDPFKVPVPGIPKEAKRAPIPHGSAINEIVPLHSPAMGGGGVNSDQLQNMMGGMFPGMANLMGDSAGPSTPQPPQAPAGPPKKPKMKRQVIR